MSPEAHIANVLYNFASFVEAVAIEGGPMEHVVRRAHEVQDLALHYITDEFRDSA